MQAICSQETTAQSDEFVYGSSSSEIATRPVTKGKAATQHRGSDKLRDANHTKRSEQPSPEDVAARQHVVYLFGRGWCRNVW